jgi:LDH2 family malate/lactate/ureidoglycolate dehydrogenase
LVAILACNGGPPGGSVAPFGGRGRALGTNPLSFSIPRGRGAPIVGDFSTSATAEGKVRVYLHSGELVPDGWLIDSDGRPSTKPADFYAGGAILPSGGHKGFALGLLVEVLGGVLAGEGCACLGEDPGNGVIMIGVDVSRFRPRAQFEAEVDRVADAVGAVPAAHGFSRVTLPGEPELAVSRARAATGLPFAEETWRSIVGAARTLGVEPDEAALVMSGERGG